MTEHVCHCLFNNLGLGGGMISLTALYFIAFISNAREKNRRQETFEKLSRILLMSDTIAVMNES